MINEGTSERGRKNEESRREWKMQVYLIYMYEYTTVKPVEEKGGQEGG
jgi:hypothetical protein